MLDDPDVAELREHPDFAGLTDEQIAHNAAIQYQRTLDRDCLAKTWFMAEPSHPAVYRALKIDPADPAAWYAAAPFRLVKLNDEHVILAAWPAPKMLSDYPEDWLDIEDVLIWRPNAGTVETPEDAQPRLIGAWGATIFGTAFAFFRAWAEERAATFSQVKAARKAHWLSDPSEVSTPGMLVLGDLKAVRMPVHTMPRDIECVGIDPKAVNAAIQRSAALPRATQSMKAVA
jgi:hypothetical protein